MTINYVSNNSKVVELIIHTETIDWISNIMKATAIWGTEPSENDKKELEDYLSDSAKEAYKQPFTIIVENRVRDQ